MKCFIASKNQLMKKAQRLPEKDSAPTFSLLKFNTQAQVMGAPQKGSALLLTELLQLQLQPCPFESQRNHQSTYHLP